MSIIHGIFLVQCLQRWRKALKPGLVKGPWSIQEDQLLHHLVHKGFKNWGKLSKYVPGRTSKQCRERWCQHLDPSLLKTEFTIEEDSQLLLLHSKMGNKWAAIARELPGRTENNVKIRFKALMREVPPKEHRDKVPLEITQSSQCRTSDVLSTEALKFDVENSTQPSQYLRLSSVGLREDAKLFCEAISFVTQSLSS
jgi:hypothetical protein